MPNESSYLWGARLLRLIDKLHVLTCNAKQTNQVLSRPGLIISIRASEPEESLPYPPQNRKPQIVNQTNQSNGFLAFHADRCVSITGRAGHLAEEYDIHPALTSNNF